MEANLRKEFETGIYQIDSLSLESSLEWDPYLLDSMEADNMRPQSCNRIAEIIPLWIAQLIEGTPNIIKTTLWLSLQLAKPGSIYCGPLFGDYLAPEDGDETPLEKIVNKYMDEFDAKLKTLDQGESSDEELWVKFVMTLNPNCNETSMAQITDWMFKSDAEELAMTGPYLAMCTLRAASSKPETIIQNLSDNFQARFSNFYTSNINIPSLKYISKEGIKILQSSLGMGSRNLCTILIPALKVHINTHQGVTTVGGDSLLQYCLLMTLEFNGIYLAESYVRVCQEVKDWSGAIITRLWNSQHLKEFSNLATLVKKYLGSNSNAKKGWKWARCVNPKFLSDFSGANNPYLTSIFTAIYAHNLSDPESKSGIWSKICFNQIGNLKDLALVVAAEYWDDRNIKGIPSDSGDLVVKAKTKILSDSKQQTNIMRDFSALKLTKNL